MRVYSIISTCVTREHNECCEECKPLVRALNMEMCRQTMEGGSIVSSHAMVHAYDTAAASLSYDPELVASEQASAYLPVTSSRERACEFP